MTMRPLPKPKPSPKPIGPQVNPGPSGGFNPQTFITAIASQLGGMPQPVAGIPTKRVPQVNPGPRPVLPAQASPRAGLAQQFIRGFNTTFGANAAKFL